MNNIYSLIQTGLFLLAITGCKNGPLTINSDNPHYFSYRNKPVVLISSDQHYGAVIDRDFDYIRFLDYLHLNGLNITRIYPGAMFELTDKYLPGNPLGPRPGRQLLPWARTDQPGANPMLADQERPSYKYDLDRWDEQYFHRLKDFVRQASKRDIIVEVAFFNGMYNDCWPLMALYHGNNIQNIGRYESDECGLFTTVDSRNSDVMDYQKKYIEKITSELNEFDNLIYDICDEPSLQGLPGGGLIYLPDSLVKPWIEHMKEAFLETEAALPKKHILGQTVQNLSPDFSGESWCDWLPVEYVKPAEKGLLMNYQDLKPIMIVESNYYGMSLTKNEYDVNSVRIEGWWFMLGGGAGCINLNGQFHRGLETGDKNTQQFIVPQKKVLKDFMSSLDLSGLSRFSDFSVNPGNIFCNILAEKGLLYTLYIFHGKYDSEWGANFIPETGSYTDSIKLNNVPGGNYTIEWIDPSSGTVKATRKLEWKGGKLDLTTPDYLLDLAMKMRRTD